jgi:hypothetical protein
VPFHRTVPRRPPHANLAPVHFATSLSVAWPVAGLIATTPFSLPRGRYDRYHPEA